MNNILEIINKDLLEKNKKSKERRKTGLWHPSGFGRCYRMQCWNRDGVEESNPSDERTLRLFECGHIFHDFVQKYLPDHQTEVACKMDDISGYADIVLEDTVVDIKSINSKGFGYIKDVRKDKVTNWLQCSAYAYILNKPKLCLMFISKDDLRIEQYGDTMEYWRPKLEEELKTLRYNWLEYKQGRLPKAEPRAYNGKECQYCNYADKCKALEVKAKTKE